MYIWMCLLNSQEKEKTEQEDWSQAETGIVCITSLSTAFNREFSSARQILSRWLISFQIRTMMSSYSYLINPQTELNCPCKSSPDMRRLLQAYLKHLLFCFRYLLLEKIFIVVYIHKVSVKRGMFLKSPGKVSVSAGGSHLKVAG